MAAVTAPKNLYYRRIVAESASKACWICFKPSSTVLITPEQDDWFHVCPGHLTDAKFATAKDAEDLAKRKRDAEIQIEIDALKKEFEEKMKKKLEKRRQKDAEKDGDKKKADKKREDQEKEDQKEEKEKEERLQELEKKKSTNPDSAKVNIDGPRIFELQKHFFQMRLKKKRDAEIARRNLQRLQNPDLFPSVPSGIP